MTAESSFNDPFEMPTLTIKSEDGSFSEECFDDTSAFTEICAIPHSELTKDRKFTVEVSCVVKCSISISAYMNKVVKLDLNDRVLISAMGDFGLANALEIQIPADAVFTQAVFVAYIQNINEVNEGLLVRANYGSPDQTAVPTEEEF